MAATPIADKDLRIRRAEPADYMGFANTMSTPRAMAGTLQLPMASLDVWRARLAGSDADRFMIVAEVRSSTVADGFDIVGHLGLMPNGSTSLRRRHAVALGMSVCDEFQRRGIGNALFAAAIERADRWMGILRIELTVFTDNAAAIALYRRHGFVIEGTHRAYALRDGAYVDAYAMARLHPRQPMLPTMPTNDAA